MKIEFLLENGTAYVVAKDQKYKGHFHDELIYGEITPFGNGFQLRWSDNFFSPEPFSSVEEAQDYALLNYIAHEPTSNGKVWL